MNVQWSGQNAAAESADSNGINFVDITNIYKFIYLCYACIQLRNYVWQFLLIDHFFR